MTGTVLAWGVLRVLSGLFMLLLTGGAVALAVRHGDPVRRRRRLVRSLPAVRYARGEIDAETLRTLQSDLKDLE